MVVKREKILSQLKKVTDEQFVAAGKFGPRGGVAGAVLGGAVGAGVGAAVGAKVASKVGSKMTKKKGTIQVPGIFYLALTKNEVVMFKGKQGVTVTPQGEIYRWKRSDVGVTRKGGLRTQRLEFTIK